MLSEFDLLVVRHLGTYNPVYIHGVSRVNNETTAIFALHDPLRQSLDAFEQVSKFEPIHVFTDAQEYTIITEHLNDMGTFYLKNDIEKLQRYRDTLAEQNIDVAFELRHAAALLSDVEARIYLADLNLRLRQHFQNFPYYHDNPVKRPGQKGSLRKSRNLPPFNITWP